MSPRRSRIASLLLLALLAPSVARAAEPLLTPVGVFLDAAPLQKLFMLSLVAAIITAVGITVRGVFSGPSLAGGSAFVSGLRVGGPLIGVLGATYCAMLSAIGVTNFQPEDIRVIAPGVAECFLVFGLGVLAGTVAVFCNWIIEARIDRSVLRA